MIRKPDGAEQESAAHEAVGKAIRIGGEVRDVGDKGVRVVRIGCIYWLLGIMAFGLITSSTPLWFKGLGLLIFAGLFSLAKKWARRLMSQSRSSSS